VPIREESAKASGLILRPFNLLSKLKGRSRLLFITVMLSSDRGCAEWWTITSHLLTGGSIFEAHRRFNVLPAYEVKKRAFRSQAKRTLVRAALRPKREASEFFRANLRVPNRRACVLNFAHV